MPLSQAHQATQVQAMGERHQTRFQAIKQIPPTEDGGVAVTEAMAAAMNHAPVVAKAPTRQDKGTVRGGWELVKGTFGYGEKPEEAPAPEPPQVVNPVPGWPDESKGQHPVIVPDSVLDRNNPMITYAYVHVPAIREAVTSDPGIMNGVSTVGAMDPRVENLLGDLVAEGKKFSDDLAPWEDAERQGGAGGFFEGLRLRAGVIQKGVGEAAGEEGLKDMMTFGVRGIVKGAKKQAAADELEKARRGLLDELLRSPNLTDRALAVALRPAVAASYKGQLPPGVAALAGFFNTATFNLAPAEVPAYTPEQKFWGEAGGYAAFFLPTPASKLYGLGHKGVNKGITAAVGRSPRLAHALEYIASKPLLSRIAALPVELAKFKAGELTYAFGSPERLMEIAEGQKPVDVFGRQFSQWFNISPTTALYAIVFAAAKGLRIDMPGGEQGLTAYEQAVRRLGLKGKSIRQIEAAYQRHLGHEQLVHTEASEPVQAGSKLADKITESLRINRKARVELNEAYRKARGERTQQFVELRDSLVAQGKNLEQATAEAKQVLTGPLLKTRPEIPQAGRPALTDGEWEVLQKAARDRFPTSNVGYTQLNASEALTKIRGGEVLTPSEIRLVRSIFSLPDPKTGLPDPGSVIAGRQLARVLRQQLPLRDRIIGTAISAPREIAMVMRAVWASGEISYSFRQLRPAFNRDIARWLTGRPSTAWFRAFGRQVSSFWSARKYEQYNDTIVKARSYKMLQGHGQIVEVGPLTDRMFREEGFSSAFADRIPLVRRSNRAAAIAGNSVRVMVADQMLRSYDARGIKVTPQIERKIASSVGNLTGRAVLPRYQSLQGFYNFANETLFSPRFLLARIENVTTLYGTLNRDPVIRSEGITRMAGTVATTVAAAYVAKMFGASVEMDFRSADFLKARHGDTRYDLTEGTGQVMRFIVRMAMAQSKNTAGHIDPSSRKELIAQFLRSKQAPVWGLVASIYTGQDWTGKRIEGFGNPLTSEGWSGEVANKFIYGWLQEVIDKVEQDMTTSGLGDALADAVPVAVAGQLGVGVQTYPNSARTRDTILKDTVAQERWGTNWENLSADQQENLAIDNEDVFAAANLAIAKEGASRDNAKAIALAEKRSKEAGRNVMARLPEDVRQAMTDAGLVITLDRKVGPWELNEERYAAYQRFVTEELKASMPKLLRGRAYRRASEPGRLEMLNDALLEAKEEADFRIDSLATKEARQLKMAR
jgi:hypothetical protein